MVGWKKFGVGYRITRLDLLQSFSKFFILIIAQYDEETCRSFILQFKIQQANLQMLQSIETFGTRIIILRKVMPLEDKYQEKRRIYGILSGNVL